MRTSGGKLEYMGNCDMGRQTAVDLGCQHGTGRDVGLRRVYERRSRLNERRVILYFSSQGLEPSSLNT